MNLLSKINSILLLLEGKDVDRQVRSILKNEFISADDETIDKWMKMINEMPQVKRSQNGKDAIPVATWVASATNGDPEFLIQQIQLLLNRKDKLEKTIKNTSLLKLMELRPTYSGLKELIKDEEEKIINGFDDDSLDQIDADDLTDDERMKLIRADLGKPTYSVPGVVDVYRADTKRQSIKYSRGYGWCIGYPDATNQYYFYRRINNGTTYFCFFKNKQPMFRDYACVVHSMKDKQGDISFRVTNAENDNGSIVVNTKQEVLNCYPDLKGVIDDMVSISYDSDEHVDKLEQDLDDLGDKTGYTEGLPLPLSFLTDDDNLQNSLEECYTKYSRKDVRKLLMKNVRLSDDLFEFIFKYFEHGKFKSGDRDNLIGLYLRLANYPLTERQKELIKSSSSMLTYHKKLHESKLAARQKAIFDRTKKTVEEDIYNLEESYDFYIGLGVAMDTSYDVCVMHECSSLSGLPNSFSGDNDLEIINNDFISKSYEDIWGYSNVFVRYCSNLKELVVNECRSRLVVYSCPALTRLELSENGDGVMDDLIVTASELPSLTTFKIHSRSSLYSVMIDNCPNLKINPGDFEEGLSVEMFNADLNILKDLEWLSGIKINVLSIKNNGRRMTLNGSHSSYDGIMNFIDNLERLKPDIENVELFVDMDGHLQFEPFYSLKKRIKEFESNNTKTSILINK